MNPNLTRVVGSSVIFLMGYFYWGWSVHFVFCFAYLDWISQEVSQHLKAKKIRSVQGGKPGRLMWLSPILLTVSILLFEIHFFNAYIHDTFINEWTAFFMLEDLGLPQGLFLVPLVALGVILEYKMGFVKTKMYLRQAYSSIYQPLVNMQLSRFSLACILLVFGMFIDMPESVLLFAIIIVPLLWEWRLKSMIRFIS